jgi:hypothetical protein
MRKFALVFAVLFLKFPLWSQGFERLLDLSVNDLYRDFRIHSISIDSASNSLVFQSYEEYNSRTETDRLTSRGIGIGVYNPQQNSLLAQLPGTIDQSLSSVSIFKLNPSLYLSRHETNIYFEEYKTTWRFLNLSSKDTALISPEKYCLSDPALKNDSVFILVSALSIRDSGRFILDQERKTYLTYLDPQTQSYLFIDSLQYPLKPENGHLSYLPESKQWELIQDSLRFRFKKGGLIDSAWVDSQLLAADLNDYQSFFRQGLSKTYRDTLGAKLYHYWYRLEDTLEYALNFEGPLLGMEELNLRTGFGMKSLKPREDGVLDWLRFMPDGSIDLHRFEADGKHFSRTFNLQDYPRYGISCMWSMPDGSFYLGGRAAKSVSKGQALLIYIDAQGNSKALLGENIFNVHYRQAQQILDVFYDQDQGQLDYKIWDVSGKPSQSGFFDVMEGIRLKTAPPGIYYLQLWTRSGEYLGRRAFIRN